MCRIQNLVYIRAPFMTEFRWNDICFHFCMRSMVLDSGELHPSYSTEFRWNAQGRCFRFTCGGIGFCCNHDVCFMHSTKFRWILVYCILHKVNKLELWSTYTISGFRGHPFKLKTKTCIVKIIYLFYIIALGMRAFRQNAQYQGNTHIYCNNWN